MPKQLDEEVSGLPDLPSKVLIPRLLALFSSQHTEAKCLAIGVANLLAGANPESLAPSLDRLAAPESSESGNRIVTRCCVVLQAAPQLGAAHAVQSSLTASDRTAAQHSTVGSTAATLWNMPSLICAIRCTILSNALLYDESVAHTGQLCRMALMSCAFNSHPMAVPSVTNNMAQMPCTNTLPKGNAASNASMSVYKAVAQRHQHMLLHHRTSTNKFGLRFVVHLVFVKC